MSDTQAAMREFRFLDEKRKTNGLTEAEESRWQELGAALGIDLSASMQPAGYYGADGLWYQYPPGYDPNAQWQQQYAQQAYAPQPGYYAPPQPQGYYDPNTGAYYPPQQPQYAQGYPPPQPQSYYDPNTGAYYPPEMYQQQQAYEPAPQYDPNQQQWDGYQPQAQAVWPQTTAPQFPVSEPAPLPPAPEPLPELLSVDRSPTFEPEAPALEEVGTDDVMEISDEEVMEVPVTAPPAPVVAKAPAPSLKLDKTLVDESPKASTPSGEFSFDLPEDDAPLLFNSPSPSAPKPVEVPPAPVPSFSSFTIDEDLADAPAPAAPEPSFSVDPVPAAAEAVAAIAAPEVEPELSVDVSAELDARMPAEEPSAFSIDSVIESAPVPVDEAPVAPVEEPAIPSFSFDSVVEAAPVAPVEEPAIPSFSFDSVVEAAPVAAVEEPAIPSFSFDSVVEAAPVEAPATPSLAVDSVVEAAPVAPVEEQAVPSFSVDPVVEATPVAPVEEPAIPSFSFDSVVEAAPAASVEEPAIPSFSFDSVVEAAPSLDPVVEEPAPSYSLDSTIEAAPVAAVQPLDEVALPAPSFEAPTEPAPSYSLDSAIEPAPSFEVDVPTEAPPLPPEDPAPLPTRSSFAAALPEFANELTESTPPAPSFVVEPEPGAPVSRSSFAVAEPGYTPGNSGISLPPDAAPIPISMPPEPVFAEPPRPTVFSTQKFFADPGAALPKPPVEVENFEWSAPKKAAAPATTAWDTTEESPLLEGEVMPELDAEVVVERQPVAPHPGASSSSAFDLLAMAPESAPRIPTFEATPATSASPFGTAWNNDAPDEFAGTSDEKTELATNADFLASVDPQPTNNVSESIDIDAGEFVVESASAAELANDFRGTGPSTVDEGKMELASNHDFIDNSELTNTGASWSNERESIALEGEEEEGEVIQGTVLEEEPEAPVVDSWAAAVAPPPPPPAPVRAQSMSNLPVVPAPVAPPIRSPSLSNLPAVPATVAPPVRSPSLSNMPAVAAPPRASTIPSLPVVQAPAAPVGEMSTVFLAGEHRVILHTMEGQVKRGAIRDAHLGGPSLQLTLANGGAETLSRDRVKALFFMLAPGSRAPATEGNKVRVTFKDGRQVAGFSKDHKGPTAGFFVVPADNRTNTERIFIFRHAVQSITVEG